MDRKNFIRQCGFACLGAISVSVLAPGCAGSRQINAPIRNDKMELALSSFIIHGKNKKVQYKRYIIARNAQLNYPIVVYRNSENDYTALLLRCSHQYNELNVNGDLLTCPAHGSEFDSKGNVVSGPADTKLRSLPVLIDKENIYIQLV